MATLTQQLDDATENLHEAASCHDTDSPKHSKQV